MIVYLDASVYIGYSDKEFELETSQLFRRIRIGWYKIAYSETVISELKTDAALELFGRYKSKAVRLPPTPKIMELATSYIEAGALPPKSYFDAVHLAYATYYDIDYLVTWDLKHIANLQRLMNINQINLNKGFGLVRVVTPKNLI